MRMASTCGEALIAAMSTQPPPMKTTCPHESFLRPSAQMSISPDLRNVRADYDDRPLRRLADLQDELALVAWQVDAEAIVAFPLDGAVQTDEQDRGVGAGRQSGGPGDGWRRVRGVGLVGLSCRILRVAALAAWSCQRRGGQPSAKRWGPDRRLLGKFSSGMQGLS